MCNAKNKKGWCFFFLGNRRGEVFFESFKGVKLVVYKSRSKFRARDVKYPAIYYVESYTTGNAMTFFGSYHFSLIFFFFYIRQNSTLI